MRRTGEIGARVDTTQRARVAMDSMTRQLRSQVCVPRDRSGDDRERSIFAGTPTSVTFFSRPRDESITPAPTPRPPTLRSVARAAASSWRRPPGRAPSSRPR